MKVKIFSAQEGNAFNKLEGEINEWLSENEGLIEIVDRQLAVSGIDDGKGEGVYQQVAIAIWYTVKSGVTTKSTPQI